MGKSNTTTTSNDPYSPAQDDLSRVVNAAGRKYSNGTLQTGVYDGERVAGFSDQTTAALDQLGAGSGLVGAATSNLTDIMSGDNMYRDMDLIRSSVADDVKAQLNSQFSGGSINSSLAGDTYTRAMTEALAGVEYDAYNNAQNRRLSALGMAPSISGMQTQEAQNALAAGLTIDDLNQRQIDADMAAFYEKEDQDLNALKEYAGIAMGVGGMGGTQTTSESVSLLEQLGTVGAAASGFGGFYDAIWG